MTKIEELKELIKIHGKYVDVKFELLASIIIEQQEQIEKLKKLQVSPVADFLSKQQSLPADIEQIISDNFWKLFTEDKVK